MATATYLSVASLVSPACANPLTAKLEQRVVGKNVLGLESFVATDTLNVGLVNDQYFVEGEYTIRNTGKAIPGSFSFFYSICLKDEGICFTGKSDKLEGVALGQTVKPINLKLRKGFGPITGTKKGTISLRDAQLEVTVRLENGGPEPMYQTDNFLPPVRDYVCKKQPCQK